MSTATSGRAREYAVRDHMMLAGWEMVMRAAGSKGPADLAMAHEVHGLALVQVGTDNKSLGPADRFRLLHAADLCSALPVLASKGARKPITYRLVSYGPAGTWEAWKP